MVKIGSLPLLFMLFASLGFAWTTGYEPPSCVGTIYTITGYNFTLITENASIGCDATTRITNLSGQVFGGTSSVSAFSGTSSLAASISTTASGTDEGYLNLSLANVTDTTFNMIVTASATRTGAGAGAFTSCDVGSLTTKQLINATQPAAPGTTTLTVNLTFTKINSTSWNVTSNNSTAVITTNNTIYINATQTNDGGSNSCTMTMNPLTVNNGIYSNISDGSSYFGRNGITTTMTWSDIKTGTNTAVPANYCQSLLYFNNPYYGNIQLIPRITYIPGVDAFANFINTTSNAAYIPNNTITYVFDSVTSIWYIVPATTCASFSIVGSTTTLQYNPTATGTAPGGTVPIDVYYLTGSCSYATATRLITCTGTDTSSTITALNLSAYLSGNTTDLCNNGTVGASGTLTCTLPAQNGSYNIIFYGQDADLFLHQFATKTVVIGHLTTTFGRDAYIAVLLLIGVAALLLSSNIAVSMVLACFGLFAALAIGALPLSDAPVVVFFTVIALVLAYRLKV